MLSAAYAYLAEQAEHADAVAEPTYRVKGLKQKEIDSVSRRKHLDDWLVSADTDAKLLAYLRG